MRTKAEGWHGDFWSCFSLLGMFYILHYKWFKKKVSVPSHASYIALDKSSSLLKQNIIFVLGGSCQDRKHRPPKNTQPWHWAERDHDRRERWLDANATPVSHRSYLILTPPP